MDIHLLIIITCICRFSLGSNIEEAEDISIWQKLDMSSEMEVVVPKDDNTKELEKEVKTFNEYLKKILMGNYSKMTPNSQVDLTETKIEDNISQDRPNKIESMETVTRKDVGKNTTRKWNSNTPSLEEQYNPNVLTGITLLLKCPKEVTVNNIDDVEGLYVRQEELINGKIYYKDTQGIFCISWHKKYSHWWIQNCRYTGNNIGEAYLEDQNSDCPTSLGASQVWISVRDNGLAIDGGIVIEYFCQTVKSEECVFPVKWGDSIYYTCSLNGAFIYRWCATSLKENGEYATWDYCAPKYKCSANPPKRGYKEKSHRSHSQILFE